MAAVVGYVAPAPWQISPLRVGRIGVWCGRSLWVVSHADPRRGVETGILAEWPADDQADLVDVVRVAFAAHCGSVWLLPVEGASPGPNDPSFLRQFPVYARLAMARSAQVYDWHELSCHKGRTLAGLVAQVRGLDGRGRGLPLCVFAAWIDQWPLMSAVENVRQVEDRANWLGTGLALAAHALGAQLRYSPSYTGMSVLRQTLSKVSYPILPLSDEWKLELANKRPSPVTWREAVLPGRDYSRRRRMLTVICYDRISSYTASAREVPVGDPHIVDGYRHGVPGVYRVTAAAPANWPLSAPGLFHVGPGAGTYPREVRDVWAWEPAIRLAMRSGWTVDCSYGYAWDRGQKHDLLREWQERVWTAVQAAQGFPGVAGVIAKRVSKRVGVATVGRLDQQKGLFITTAQAARDHHYKVLAHTVDAYGDLDGFVEVEGDLGATDLVMPHWRACVIANANERLLNAIVTQAPKDTRLAYVDALFTLQAHEELEGSEQLGKFRRKSRTRIALAELSNINELSAAGLVKWLAHKREDEDAEGEDDEQ